MATYTWVDLDIPESTLLADLNGVSVDLHNAREMALTLKREIESERPNWQLAEPYSIAISVMYSRPFVTGVRERLREENLSILSPEQRAAHERLRTYRDKHIAHSVNVYEKNLPRANYCAERVHEEGITAISCSHSRVIGLSGADLENVIELTTTLLSHVDELMDQEKKKLLHIVRAMKLETVLKGGKKAFALSGMRMDRARKK